MKKNRFQRAKNTQLGCEINSAAAANQLHSPSNLKYLSTTSKSISGHSSIPVVSASISILSIFWRHAMTSCRGAIISGLGVAEVYQDLRSVQGWYVNFRYKSILYKFSSILQLARWYKIDNGLLFYCNAHVHAQCPFQCPNPWQGPWLCPFSCPYPCPWPCPCLVHVRACPVPMSLSVCACICFCEHICVCVHAHVSVSMLMVMQHGDMNIQHGHGHAAWTWTS